MPAVLLPEQHGRSAACVKCAVAVDIICAMQQLHAATCALRQLLAATV